MDEKEYVELETEFIVLAIPQSTVEVTISAKVWDNSKVTTVERTMPFNEVRDAFREAEEGYTPSNAVYVLNPDISKSKLELLIKKYLDRAEGNTGES